MKPEQYRIILSSSVSSPQKNPINRLLVVRSDEKQQRANQGKKRFYPSADCAHNLNAFCEWPWMAGTGIRLELSFPSVNLLFGVPVLKPVQLGHDEGHDHIDGDGQKDREQRKLCPPTPENCRYGTEHHPIRADKRIAQLKTGAGEAAAPRVESLTYTFERFNRVFICTTAAYRRLPVQRLRSVRHRFYRPPPGPLAALFVGDFLAAAFFAGAFLAAAFFAGAFFAAFFVAIILFLRVAFCHINREASLVVCNR
jgi:hypothetical protein